MDASSEAAEQIVRMTLEGTEVALRITGAGAKNAAAMLLAAAASNEKTKGRARLSAMLKSGRELRVFPIRFDDLKGFAKEARRYGIAYAVVKQKDGESVDLLVRTEDASKVNRIAERLGLCRMRDDAREAPEPREGNRHDGRAHAAQAPRAPEQAAALLDDLLASPGDSDASPLAQARRKAVRQGLHPRENGSQKRMVRQRASAAAGCPCARRCAHIGGTRNERRSACDSQAHGARPGERKVEHARYLPMMEERSSREFAPEGEFDKQAWAERKQSERQEAFDRADAAALRANSDPAALETYMRVAAQLPHHSATNILLIADRIPNATRVGTAEHWRRQGASVRRGQRRSPSSNPSRSTCATTAASASCTDVRKVFDVSQDHRAAMPAAQSGPSRRARGAGRSLADENRAG